jgi:hypothetical protein
MHLIVEHYRPSNRQQVATDDFSPTDLCGSCKEDLRRWFTEHGKPWPPPQEHMKEMAMTEDTAYVDRAVPESLTRAAEDLVNQ